MDDEPVVGKVVGKRLAIEGFTVQVALDGEEALAMVRAAPPDLIILDLMLPRLDGHEVCKILKQDARYQRIPIVIFTAKPVRKDEEMAMASGANAYVRKPFRAEELIGKIRQLLSPPSP